MTVKVFNISALLFYGILNIALMNMSGVVGAS